MANKDRANLKSHFVKYAIPTEGDFADLIDSQLNQAEDGVFKVANEPLGVIAASGDQRRVLRLYGTAGANPDWMIALNPLQDPNNAGSTRPGFGITDGAGRARLFVEAGTGRVGLGTNTPQADLEVAGEIKAGLGSFYGLEVIGQVALQGKEALRASGNWLLLAGDFSGGVVAHSHFITDALSVRGGMNASPGNPGWGNAWISGELTIGRRLEVGGDVALGGKHAFRSSDNWLRLNQDGAFAAGVHTPGNFAPGALNVGGMNAYGNPGAGNAWIAGTLVAAGGVRAYAIGLGTQEHGKTGFPHETIQMYPGHNLRLWYGTTERFFFSNNGTFIIRFDQGYWVFQDDGNLVKFRNDGTPLWQTRPGW